jgi:CubicO group peptidase (beta-lactamase class C family)
VTHAAPSPALGTVEPGFEPVARLFASQLASGEELGASFAVFHRGRCVVDLWGGLANRDRKQPWERDTRVVLFSVTKGLASMALSLLADRGQLEWDAPVATYWPGFAREGKSAITLRQLFNHRAGLPVLDAPFTLAECCDPKVYPRLVDALERQQPAWKPGEGQGYHGITFGMYAREVFERIAKEPIGGFLARELFGPLGADVSLGTAASLDERVATLYAPTPRERVRGMAKSTLGRLFGSGDPGTEARIARSLVAKGSLARRAFLNPSSGPRGIEAYGEPSVWRAELAWASATGTAHGVARAYLPFALGGSVDGRAYLRASTIAPIHGRQGWAERDAVLQKPLGWSQGFLKEEPQIFSPTRESFGHPGIGGALGWCDPVEQLTIGYAMNRLDWRVRSARALALCRAVYACVPAVRSSDAAAHA